MTHANRSAAISLDPNREKIDMPTDARRTPAAMWARVVRFLVLLLIGAVAVVGAVDSIYAWKTKLVLANAARAAATIAISTPLNAKGCRDATPCSIESAAAAAKLYLTSAGFTQASCIDPENPSFSGVLVWIFSCDGSSSCDRSDGAICVKVDMTPVVIERNGTLVPYTRATVQFPHNWIMALLLRPLPDRLSPRLPMSVSGSVLLRN